MRRMFLLALLLPALSAFALADSSLTFQNLGGSLRQSNAGVTLTKSKLTSITGLNGGGTIVPTSSGPIKTLGGLSFGTGTEISSTYNSATKTTTSVFAGGGFFTITGFGQDGVPKGIIFSGTFSGPVTVTSVARTPTTPSEWMLTGNVSGTYNGFTISGMTMQMRVAGRMTSGATSFASAVPEQGTLGLLGTGLLGVAEMVRRKNKSNTLPA
jgi:hypothetical protein